MQTDNLSDDPITIGSESIAVKNEPFAPPMKKESGYPISPELLFKMDAYWRPEIRNWKWGAK